jgi:predicted amidohydrolase YtcJ
MRRLPGLAILGLLAACLGGLACHDATPAPADLVLFGGKIVTLESGLGEVQALAARDGVIVALGTDAEIRRYAGIETRSIDLEGRLVVPGFIEGHGHFTGIGAALMNIELRSLSSWNEVVEVIAAAAAEIEPGQWILGWGWHQNEWDDAPRPSVEGYPTHAALSAAVPDHPVLLKHAAGGHAGILNARAMELAGIDRDTPDPAGGRILRDSAGDPTGVLRETAYDLGTAAYERSFLNATAEAREALARHEISLADRECLSRGITSFQDAGSDFETVDRFRRIAEAGELGLRLWVMLSSSNDELEARIDEYRLQDVADSHLTVRAIKRSIDGALGSHGAWLLEPYSDLPREFGHNTLSIEELEATAAIAAEHGFQLCVHAIGDRGNRETLDLYEQIFERYPETPGGERRWRIEHAQHLSARDIPRFADLGLIASMQGVHCTSDAPWVPQRLGNVRAEEGAYVWRKLIDSGVRIVNGTDAPIEDVDPLASFYSSITRKTEMGETFYPEQRMTRMEALRSYTINAAYAAFEEQQKGSLAPGKLADVTVLSRDILSVPEEQILETEVLYTIVGGQVLYEKDGA